MLIFKEKEIKEKDYTLRNYRAVKVDYEGDPMFFTVALNLNALIMIDRDGDFSSMPMSCAHWEDLWENTLRNKYFYGGEDSWEIIEYFEDFDIAITNKS